MASLEYETPPKDLLSCANTEDYKLRHLDWEAEFDFSSKTVTAAAELHFRVCASASGLASVLLLDTHGINVRRVSECESNRELKWELGETGVLGAPLSIHLVSDMLGGERKELKIRVEYATSPDATALQWLAAEQTKGTANTCVIHIIVALRSQLFLRPLWGFFFKGKLLFKIFV